MTMRAISHYEILDKLGAGGTSEVYRARVSKIRRNVAIAVLPAELANDGHYAERLQREARILGSLSHPHIRDPTIRSGERTLANYSTWQAL